MRSTIPCCACAHANWPPDPDCLICYGTGFQVLVTLATANGAIDRVLTRLRAKGV